MIKRSAGDGILKKLMERNPKDIDIENADFKDQFSDNNSQGDSESDSDSDNFASTEHYLKVGRSKLRDNSIKISDPKYAGNTTSRTKYYAESEGDSESDASTGNGSDSDSGKTFSQNTSFSDDQNEENEEDDEEEEEDDDEGEENDNGNLNNKKEKLKNLLSQERKIMLNRLSKSAKNDALKGYSILKQQNHYDLILDCRIKIQDILSLMNSLPSNNENLDKLSSNQTASMISKLKKQLYKLLEEIIKLRIQMNEKDNIIDSKRDNKSKSKIKSKKRTLSEYFNQTSELDDILLSFSNNTLTKWSNKIQSISGSSALNNSKFSVVNQSITSQIDSNLANMDRLVKRTKINRKNAKAIDHEIEFEKQKNQRKQQVQPNVQKLENEMDEIDEIENKNKIDQELQENKNIFDDNDFYKILLNDFVDKKISDSNLTKNYQLTLTKSKFKKNFDTKASKGRKIRYQIQKPLQNYEAPNFKKKRWNDYQIDEFFAGLLGQTVNFNEETSDEEVGEEREYRNFNKEMINDNIKIFG
ncbi:rRNA-processing protein BFR2 [Ascoidea rubescens DSM 1968]|uniref:Protein BFR2 n=1 Tax=Ascoidea rubescens DSM 1968 TaxID=1344418 RepID=A0A1D2VPP1_9ASCO|nr:TRAUB-domain-containing protein [Ascoidea rubescens DSM 1968]ODV63578.1 TRAUB-domain-containing protein [Ascoidea rubescens DSM 1968]